MSKRGRTKLLVNAVAEFWPIKKLKYLPEMRGIYILYDKNKRPVYCGRSGKGKSCVGDRISFEKSTWRYYRSKIAYFSAFDLDRGNHHQVETLILHSMGHILGWTERKNRWPRTTKTYPPP